MKFHFEAEKRYEEIAKEVLSEVHAVGPYPTQSPSILPHDVHVSHVFTSENASSVSPLQFGFSGIGEATDVTWLSKGMRVGWRGESFKRIKGLANMMMRSLAVQEVVSDRFALETLCQWLCQKLEQVRSDSLCKYFAEELAAAVQPYHIWIPLFRTYSGSAFSIGNVEFRAVSKGMFDKWGERIPASLAYKAEAQLMIESRREKWQGLLAGCTSWHAEEGKSIELARSSVRNSVALLSFVSPANRNSRLTNFSTILGSERLDAMTAILVESDRISTFQDIVTDGRQADWNLDRIPSELTWVLPALNDLASNRTTELRRSLYDALILHSRQAQAIELSDKLVFALAALESMFLIDANEPIQKNLGERLAFLVGTTVEERKAIVKNVGEVYKVRSAFVHHGQVPRHQDALDRFLIIAWDAFAGLLRNRDQYKTKAALLGALEDRKMS